MAVVNPPSFLQNVATEQANSGRMMLSGLVPCPGVVGTNDLKSVQHAGTPGMSIDIPGGQLWIAGTESGVQGTYHAWSDSTVTNPSVAASDPTNPRIDRIVGKVRDQFYSTAFNQWDLAVVTGIAKAVPLLTDAPAPNNSYTLGYITVRAASTSILTSDITDLRNRAVGLGAGGLLINGFVEQTANQSGVTTQVDATSLSRTVAVPANRLLKITGILPFCTNTTANSGGIIYLLQDGTVVASGAATGSNGTAPNFELIAIKNGLNPTAGVHTYKVQLQQFAGTALATNSTATAPSSLSIEDQGPA
jgi:hypothetical protein